MLNGGYSWRLFFYVEFAFAGALLILAFFVVEETLYNRKRRADLSDGPDIPEKSDASPIATTIESATVAPRRKTFAQQLKFWGVHQRDTDFFLMMARSFTYFLVPHVLWVVTTYGKPENIPSSLNSWTVEGTNHGNSTEANRCSP